MLLCLWCDDPTGSEDKLCPGCRAVHDHPPFHCTVPGHTIPTLGPCCAECESIRLAEERRAAANAPLIEELKAILNVHMENWHKPWPGAEFGKSMVGNMIVNAIRDLGGTVTIPSPGPRDEMSRLLRDDPAEYARRASEILAERSRARAAETSYGDK